MHLNHVVGRFSFSFPLLLALGFLVDPVASHAAAADEPRAKPNIVLLFADDK